MLNCIRRTALILISTCVFSSFQAVRADDPLPSWNECPAKQSIIAFVEKVSKDGSPEFVEPELRIATFDNDGTLWCEQPMYFQELFAFDRIKELAEKHSEWKGKEPYKFVLDGDLKALAAQGEKSLLEIVSATHAGMS